MGDDDIAAQLASVLSELEPLEAALQSRLAAERSEIAALTHEKQTLRDRLENAPQLVSELEARHARAVEAAKGYAFSGRDETRAKLIVGTTMILSIAITCIWVTLNLRSLIFQGLALQVGSLISGYFVAWGLTARRRR